MTLKEQLKIDDFSSWQNILAQAQRMEPELIAKLLAQPELKEQFFTEIMVEDQKVLSFQSQKFIQFLQREAKRDRHTTYQAEIGLAATQEFLTQRNAVQLVWPHKDCLLEGGQTTEENSRAPLFFNQELAQDEISLLLSPKQLTNGKRFSIAGEQDCTDFERDAEINQARGLPEDTITDNLIIKGDNLLALYSIKEAFEGKIKLIYIDVPYNTSNDSFQYNDRFSHASWLGFMRDRLVVARELLADDGLIFVHIDSSRNSNFGSPELPYLHVLMDEIFGRKNFIGHLHWKKKKQPSFLSRIAGIMESILVYSRNEKKIGKLQLGATSDLTTRIDNRSNKISEKILRAGIRVKDEINSVLPKGVYKNKTMMTEYLDDVVIKDGRTTNEIRVKARFRNNQSEITRFCEEDLIFITKNKSLRRDKSQAEKTKKKTITDLLLDWGQNQDATKELRQLFGDKPFATPKPELLLHNLIEATTNQGDLVLDFFLGSGTTAAVAHKMGRQYIGIEQLDFIETIVNRRLQKVIEGEQGGISMLRVWEGGGSFVYFELKKYNQGLIEKLQEAKTTEQLISIWNSMKEKSLLLELVELKKLDLDIQKPEEQSAFHQLSLNEKKHIFLEVLNKNFLYVPLEVLEDKDFTCTEQEKHLTNSFYQK